jgi:hypothetical protein
MINSSYESLIIRAVEGKLSDSGNSGGISGEIKESFVATIHPYRTSSGDGPKLCRGVRKKA